MIDIFDNRLRLLGDDIRAELKKGCKVRIAAACFSMYAFEVLKKELSGIAELNFLITEPAFLSKNNEAMQKVQMEFHIPKTTRESSIYGSEYEIRLKNKMNMRAIAKECVSWINEKVKLYSNTTYQKIPNFIGIENSDGAVVYTPVEGFTTTELGYEKGNDLFCLITKHKHIETTKHFFALFDNVFKDTKVATDVTDNIVKSMNSAICDNSPEFIYYFILSNLFTDFLDDINLENMPQEATGFKKSKIYNSLYNFQKDGVISIINKLQRYDGCILADSVGLGKTFTALAVMQYYSLKNRSILVLTPKRLADNWNQYKGNVNTNTFVDDKIRFDVFYHTDLGRQGYSNGVSLGSINWGNYDLVVIDESHNFRNNTPVKNRMTRYDFLMSQIMSAGIKTKLLMLSATPVNNRYNDLKNQLALIYGGDFQAFDTDEDIKSPIAQVFRQAQRVFNEWSKKHPSKRKTKDLLDSLDIDFKVLLDKVTIARSRKNIIKYYQDATIGKFPIRRKPISKSPELTDLDIISYKEIYQSINKTTMSVYAPFTQILDSKKSKYEHEAGKLIGGSEKIEQEGRDTGLKRLMTVNLLKRLESSVAAFRITLQNMIKINDEMIECIDLHDKEPNKDFFIDKTIHEYDSYDPDEDDGAGLIATDEGKTIKINLKDVDCITWKREIINDINIFKSILEKIKMISPEHDTKLQTLKSLITEKIKNPINPNNRKVLIFSAFADTTSYLYKSLASWLENEFGLATAKVQGGNSKNECTLDIDKKTDTLLTCFSPISKNRDEKFNIDPKITGKNVPWAFWGKDANKDIDVLIGTDCISEGQNLQDCDICINYDIHWNPVRIVQRFGRIDRLGSINDEIQLVNFWPTISLDEYIKLSNRVMSRMVIVNQSATADDNILDPDEVADDYRSVQIQKMQKGEIQDLEDMDGGVSITDLGLNEFRLDVAELYKKYGKQNNTPKGLHSVIKINEAKNIEKGTIFILKNRTEGLNIHAQNRLHPYYLIYITDDGSVKYKHLQAKEILDTLRISGLGMTEPIKDLCKLFNKETHDGQKMTKQNKLLENAITSIIEVKESSDTMDLFRKGSDVLFTETIKGLDDFELIAFVVVR